MLTQCLIQLLHAQPTLCEHLPSIGFLPSIVQALECKSNTAIVASAVKVVFALCKSDICLQTFSTKCPQIISALKQAMLTRKDQLGKKRRSQTIFLLLCCSFFLRRTYLRKFA